MQEIPAALLSKRWLDEERIFPTRSLELAISAALERAPAPNAAGIALAALSGEPGIASDHVQLLEWLERGSTHASSAYTQTSLASRKSSGGSLPFSYFAARRKTNDLDVHRIQFSPDEDYRPDPIKEWAAQKGAHRRSIEDVQIIGPGDYLRLTAWIIDHHADHLASSMGYGYGRLLRDGRVGKRKLVKALKRAASDLMPAEYLGGGHQEIIMMLVNDRISLRPTSYLASGQMRTRSTHAEDAVIAQSLTAATKSTSLHEAILEFEELLNSNIAAESDYQKLFEEHPSLLLGTDYKRLIPQPILIREDEENLVPDFVLVPHVDGQPKILDLKRPDSPIYRADKNRQGFLASVLRARDQLLEYRTYFNSREVAQRMSEALGVDLYLPKISVVIGRSDSFPSQFERRKAEARIPDLEVLTYDDILSRARRLIDFQRSRLY